MMSPLCFGEQSKFAFPITSCQLGLTGIFGDANFLLQRRFSTSLIYSIIRERVADIFSID